MGTDDTRISNKKNELKKAIAAYYIKNAQIYQSTENAVTFAAKRFLNNYVDLLGEALQQLIDDRNKDTTASGFLIDLMLAGILGPVAGHVAEAFGKKFLKKFINNKTRDISISKELLFDAKVKKDIFDNIEDKTYEKLIPGTSEKVSQSILSSLSKRQKNIISELESSIATKQEIVSMAEFVEYNSPAGNDIIQAIFGKVVDLFVSKKDETLQKIYNIVDEKHRPKEEKPSVLSIISNLETTVHDHTLIRIQFDLLYKQFYDFIADISNDVSAIEELTKYFKNQKKILDNEIPSVVDPTIPLLPGIPELEVRYREYFEAVFWILYLGDPEYWIRSFGDVKFERLDETRYDEVKQIGKVYKISLGKDSKIVPGRTGRLKGEPEMVFGLDIYTPKLKLNISKKLFIYLTNNFHKGFGTETLYQEARRTKYECMGKKETGFGIEAPEPLSLQETKKDRSNFIISADSPYIDPREFSGILLYDWFNKINESLTKNTELIGILAGKYSNGVPKRFFKLIDIPSIVKLP